MPLLWEGKPYRHAVAKQLAHSDACSVLDLATGDGWLAASLPKGVAIDGVDLFQAIPPPGYRTFVRADINKGLPPQLGRYDAIVCCEAIAYLTNPGNFLDSIAAHLNPGGIVIISTPNPLYIGSRLLIMLRGCFPGFSYFLKNSGAAAHMPWSALGWPQLWFLLGQSGFGEIKMLDVPEKKPKHFWEALMGLPAMLYCKGKARKSSTSNENRFWGFAGSKQHLFGRRLVVCARLAANTGADIPRANLNPTSANQDPTRQNA
ncbi:MAG TPA: class I SAM-dependent methyltransferase [Rhodocyclaceae bacterium]|nr:class I SAM-dependent methyltransferase [Rhodocyclaceae bacterium]